MVKLLFPAILICSFSFSLTGQSQFFKALGNDPTWGIEVQNNRLAFKEGEEEKTSYFTTDLDLAKALPEYFIAKGDADQSLKILLEKGTCRDDRSGKLIGEFKVNVVKNGKLYQGCGSLVTIDKVIKGVEYTKSISFSTAMEGNSFKLKPKDDPRYPQSMKTINSEEGLKFSAVYENKMEVLLPVAFQIGLKKEEEDGKVLFPKPDNTYSFANYDFDNDRIDELIIAVVDASKSNQHTEINVLKYYPPLRTAHVYRPENWELIGTMTAFTASGRSKIEIKDGKIIIPRNDGSFNHTWRWEKGKFIDISGKK